MAEIIERRHEVEVERFSLAYDYIGETNWGFGFDCDRDGNVDVEKMNPAARENYEECLAGTNGTEYAGVQDFSYSYRVGPILRCDCGHEMELDGFTNECRCGADYNGSGQRLAPRSHWGEETGESLGDILRIP